MKHFRLIITAIILTLGLTMVESLHAATFVVTNTNDSGAGSLRQAILDANANTESNTINFDPTFFGTPRTITLTSGDLFIRTDGTGYLNTKVMTINGPGADKLTLDGNNHSRIFRIEYYGRVFINSVKVTNGNGMDNGFIPDTNSKGGGIFVEGGGHLDGSTNLVLTNSIVTNNTSAISYAHGGGMLVSGRVTLINCAVVNNTTTGAAGGVYANATLTVINSTISHNVGGSPGAIDVNAGSLYLINSTVAFNRTPNGSGVGGIHAHEGQNEYSFFHARNSIIANNTGSLGADIYGRLSEGGNNLIGNTTGTFIYNTVLNNVVDVDPQLNSNLSTNGGVIPYHAVGAYSPVIDAGNNCVLTTTANGGCYDTTVLTDARGVTRPQDGDGNGTATVDMGAFEATRAEVLNAPSAAPDLQAASDTGVSSTDNITSNTNLTFNVGGVTTGATVEFLRDGVVIGTTTAASNSVVFSDSGLTDGVHVYASRQVIGGVTSLQSAPVSVTVDTVAPVGAVNQATGQADPTRVQPINYTVVFNEPIADFTASDISFADSTANVSSAVVNITATDAVSYNVSVGNITADGVVVVSLPVHVVKDLAGNLSLASTATDNRVTLDATAPTVTINQESTQADPTNATPIRFTVVFSEPVTGFTNADVSLAGSTANVNSASKTVTGSGATYTVSISNVSSNGGFVQASIPALAAVDTAGNESAAATSTDNKVTLDNIAPTVTIIQAIGQSDPTNALPVNFTVTFSEPVTGFDSADILFTGSSVNTSGAIVTITGSGANYNVAISGNITSNGGFIRPSIRFAAATDALGNSSNSSMSTDNTVTIDNVAPNVSINQSIAQADPTSVQPINFTVVFSEIVNGFNAADVSLAGSTANVSSAVINVSGSGNVYTVSVSNVTSSGQVRATVATGAAQDAIGNLSNAATSTDNTVTVTVRRPFIDFDGDGRTDISIFRPSVGEWWINRSSNATGYALQFGSSTDKLTPADFTGDGKTDIAFFRPASGEWFVLRSEDNSFYSFPFGTTGDSPIVGDFDADGKADAGVFRPSTATWYVRRSTDGGTIIQQFGQSGDLPVVADYDGDGNADFAIYRPAAGEWWIQRSTQGLLAFQFGTSTDKPVQGDYTGDGKADVAFFRNGEWFVLRSENQSYYSFPFGTNGDTPTAGDYDGDGKFDAAVFRAADSTWYAQRTTGGTLIQQFGQSGDVPVPSAFVP
jgi:hypothetical protein